MLIRLCMSVSRSVVTGTKDEATDTKDATAVTDTTVAVSAPTVTAIAKNETVTTTVSERRQFDRWLAEIAENEKALREKYRRKRRCFYTVPGLKDYQIYAKCVADMTRCFRMMESL